MESIMPLKRRMGEAWEIGSNHKGLFRRIFGRPGSGEVGGVPKKSW